jgi:membrane protein implicated in regulation of membrane protease activity
MSRYWFKPHTHGYGATPSGWKGWAAIGVFVAAILALSLSLVTFPAETPTGAKAWQIATWAILVAVLTLAFIRFCRSKTDGEWAWRWGGKRSGVETKRVEPESIRPQWRRLKRFVR